MKRDTVPGRGLVVALLSLLVMLCAWTAPVFAQSPATDPAMKDLAQEQAKRRLEQPGNNAPVWREVRGGDPSARTSAPGREVNVLVQTEGQEWRARRNGFWAILSGWAIVGMLLVLAAAYWFLGTAQLHEPETGRKIQRFTNLQRWVHWSVAISFSILAISGLVMLFGKNILLPIIGYTLFSWLAIISKNAHNFIGPLFFISVLIMVVIFIRENIPRLYDIKWLARLGGLIGKGHVPSGKFNAGEKIWFWGGVLTLGMIVSLSGLVLDFPNFDQTRATMQTANIIHLIGSSLFMLGGLGHIYLGTVGMAGAYQGMRTGLVDETWAKEHHEYWYNDVKSGRINSDPEGDSATARRVASGSAD